MNTKKNKKDVEIKAKKNLDVGSDKKLHNKTGKLGENIAVVFLEKRGFQIIDRNYRNKAGEIDIVAQKDDFYYVVEVKTLKIPSGLGDIKSEDNLYNSNLNVIRDSNGISWLHSELNLTKEKIWKIKQVAVRYCSEFNLREESFKFIGMCVSLYYSGSRVTKENLLSCKVKVSPLFE
jgi:hypothetical protein